jgi:hypothetical protein
MEIKSAVIDIPIVMQSFNSMVFLPLLPQPNIIYAEQSVYTLEITVLCKSFL